MSTRVHRPRGPLVRPRHVYRGLVVAGFTLADLGLFLLFPVIALIVAGVALALYGLVSLAGTVRP